MTSPELTLELTSRRLVGQILARVHYLDAGPVQRGGPGDRDVVGLAVYLVFASGTRFELRNTGAIELCEITMIAPEAGRLEDASQRWGNALGARIRDASARYPRSFILELANARRITVHAHGTSELLVVLD